MEKRKSKFRNLIFKVLFSISFCSLLTALICLNAKERAEEEKRLQRQEKQAKRNIYSDYKEEILEEKVSIPKNY